MSLLDGRSERPPIADLAVVAVGALVLAAVVVTELEEPRPVAIAVVLPVVLLVPGYALVAAVFPEAGDTAPDAGTTSWIARLVLSVGGSVVAIAVVGIALDFSVWGFQREAVVLGLSAVTLAATALAWVRRRRLQAGSAAGISADGLWARLRTLPAGETPFGALLTVLVLAAVVGAVAVVADDSRSSGAVTEFYVLGPDEDGGLVAGSYPDRLVAGTPTTVGIGVGTTRAGGFEGRVVATLERLTVEDGTAVVTETQRLGAFDVAVAAGERRTRRHTVQPSLVGSDLRLTYRLYERGSESPLRRVQVGVTVESAE